MKCDSTPIYGTENKISVREIKERIEYLRDYRDEYTGDNWEEEPEADELEYLSKAFDAIDGEGETLIHDREWKHYITQEWEQVVEDSDLPAIIKNNINWGNVADDARANYTEIDVDGATYWLV